MKFRSLTNEEKTSTGGMTHRLDFDVSDIPAGIATNTAYTFNTNPLPILKAGMIVRRVLMYLTTPLKDASDANYNSTTISIGDAGSATRFINAVQLNENGTEVITSFPGTENTIYTGDSQVQVSLGSMAAKTLSDIDTGRLYVLFAVENAAAAEKKQAFPFSGGGYT